MITTYPSSSVSNPIIVGEQYHEQIVAGYVFVHNGVHSVASGATLYHTLTTSTKQCNLKSLSLSANAAPITLELSESPTITSAGTAGSIVNKSRISAITPTALIKENPTVTVIGTHLEGDIIVGTKQTGGSGSAIEDLWVLSANTTYLFKVVNGSAGTTDISLHIEWYEV